MLTGRCQHCNASLIACARILGNVRSRWHQRLICLSPRSPSPAVGQTNLLSLSPEFALAREWQARKVPIDLDSLGGDEYEWISQVQKKFTGGGRASAVDIDLAATMVKREDTLADLLDLCYKLRHTENAGDLFPSTEYAIYRLILDSHSGTTELFLKIINDPINFGLFPNEHICCLFLDHFLKEGNLQCATKLATVVMQQELFDFPLLVQMATRALLLFLESSLYPAEQEQEDQIDKGKGSIKLDSGVQPRRAATLEDETDFNEENVRFMRFPWLKTPIDDDHFDLQRTDQLVGKSLHWFSWNLDLATSDDPELRYRNEGLREAIHFLGLVLRGQQLEAAVQSLQKLASVVGQERSCLPILASALGLGRQFCLAEQQADTEGEGQNTEGLGAGVGDDEQRHKLIRQELMTKMEELLAALKEGGDGGETPQKMLSKLLAEAMQPTLDREQQRLMYRQRQWFQQWDMRRKQFIDSQTERLELTVRLRELRKRQTELKEERELFWFFENRHTWEDKAQQRTRLEEELGMLKQRGQLTEEEYSQGLFYLARSLEEGKKADQIIRDITEMTKAAPGTEHLKKKS